MFVSSENPGSATAASSLLHGASATQKTICSSEKIFYPKARGFYKSEGIKLSQQLGFRAKNEDALFYRITLTKECGKRGLAIESEHVKEMKEFLAQNDIPIVDDWYSSEGQYYDNLGLAHYYTTNADTCMKLAKILLQVNQFDTTGLDKSTVEEFTKFR